MTTYARNSRSYQQARIASASPLQLVVISYEAVIGHIAAAKRAIESRAIEQRAQHINLACAIIADLHGALDMKGGSGIAISLHRLYGYITRRLCEANAAKDPRILEECHELLSSLWSAWKAIAENNAASRDAATNIPGTPVREMARG